MVLHRKSPLVIVAGGLASAAVFVGLKVLAHRLGWEVVVALSVVTSLLGGVIFVLAILLSGVLADFKESERLVSEISSTLRRAHANSAMVAEGKMLRDMRAALRHASASITEDLRTGKEVRTGRVMGHVDRFDALLVEIAQGKGANSAVRTLQVEMGSLTKAIDRVETIMETTFLRAGYVFAGFVIAGALTLLTITRIEPFGQALALHAFASFLLSGLFLLVHDLDNPFDGALAVSVSQLEKVNTWLHSSKD